MIIIFWLSSIPNLKWDDNAQAEFFRRKFAHLVEYGLLCVLIYRGLVGKMWLKEFKKNFQKGILALVITILYSTTDELHQMYVPTREGKLTDLIFDSFGGILGLSVTNLVSTMKKKDSKKNNLPKDTKEKEMPSWPIFLGVFILLAGFVSALLYYNSYCHFLF